MRPTAAPVPTFPVLALFALAVAGVGACGDAPSYELRWSLGCASGDGPCEVLSARDCASVGIGMIEVQTRQGTRRTSRVFPCFTPGDGALGSGPGLSAGEVQLTATALTADGSALAVEPSEITAVIPSTGRVELEVDLQVPPACSDGVDNDGDGQVDHFDPECDGDEDRDENS